MDKHPSRARRFVKFVGKFPGLHILWAICTFGYQYPRKRKGENLAVCIFKYLVILVFRFTCVIGAIWYLNNWISYISKGESRPFNVLERQEARGDGIPVPMLEFFTSNPKTITIDSVDLVNTTKRVSLISGQADISQLTYSDLINGTETLGFNLTDLVDILPAGTSDMVSIEVGITQNISPTSFQWAQVGLMHPWDSVDSTNYSQQDISNQYFFLPGQYVEISFIPLHVEQPKTPGQIVTVRDKFVEFFGFGKPNQFTSYRSIIKTFPLPTTYKNTSSVIILRPYMNQEIFTYQDEKVRFRDMLSSVGGLIGTIGGAIGFLFGASLLSPWGFIAGFAIFRRRITGSLANAYDNHGGLSKGPFTTPFKENGEFPNEIQTQEARIKLLKERIDELEMVLKEFYLDGKVFEEYGAARDKINHDGKHHHTHESKHDEYNAAEKSEYNIV